MRTTVFKNSLLILLFAGLLLQSCKKKEETVCIPNYVIEGHLYKDCNFEAMSNVYLQLIQSAPNGLNYGGLLDSTTTDSTGYYRFEFPSKKGMELYIKYSKNEGGNVIHNFIPKDTSIYDLNLFFFPSVHLEVHLNVLNSYSNLDTLLLFDYKSWEGLNIPGPFKSGMAFRTENIPLFEMSYEPNWFVVSAQLKPFRDTYFDTSTTIYDYCDNTVKVTLDIK